MPQDLKDLVRERPEAFSAVVQVLAEVEKADLRAELIQMAREGASVLKIKARYNEALREAGEGQELTEAQKRAQLEQHSKLALDHLEKYLKDFADAQKPDEFLAAERKRLLALKEKLDTALGYTGSDD